MTSEAAEDAATDSPALRLRVTLHGGLAAHLQTLPAKQRGHELAFLAEFGHRMTTGQLGGVPQGSPDPHPTPRDTDWLKQIDC